MAYVRKGKRTMRKLTRKPYRKTYTKKKFGKTGFFKITRWSNLDSTNQCHLTIAGNDTVPQTQGVTTFAFSNVNGYAELQSLFDNMRLVRVLYRWVIVRDPQADGIVAANRGLFPRINWIHDFNDGTSISRAQMYQHGNMRECFFSESHQKTRWYSLKPAVVATVFESLSTNAYTPKWRQWLDSNDGSAPHYGIKYFVDQNQTNQTVRLEAKLVMECKGIS